ALFSSHPVPGREIPGPKGTAQEWVQGPALQKRRQSSGERERKDTVLLRSTAPAPDEKTPIGDSGLAYPWVSRGRHRSAGSCTPWLRHAAPRRLPGWLGPGYPA